MIRNLLYSLFLHFLLILLIYANFNLKYIEISQTSEISVSLLTLSGNEASNKTSQPSPEEVKPKINPENKASKKPMSQVKSKKNKVKPLPKKPVKSKPAKSVAAPTKEKNSQEAKAEEKLEKKQQDSEKIKEEVKEDEVINENKDNEKTDNSKKEKDLGSEKEFTKEQASEEQKQDQQSDSVDSVNNIESLDLSAREKFNIQSQLKRCYKRAISESGYSSEIQVIIKIEISQEGYIDSNLENIIDQKRYTDPKDAKYKISIDNTRRSLELCSPIRNLPLDKYDIWKEIMLDFNEK